MLFTCSCNLANAFHTHYYYRPIVPDLNLTTCTSGCQLSSALPAPFTKGACSSSISTSPTTTRLNPPRSVNLHYGAFALPPTPLTFSAVCLIMIHVCTHYDLSLSLPLSLSLSLPLYLSPSLSLYLSLSPSLYLSLSFSLSISLSLSVSLSLCLSLYLSHSLSLSLPLSPSLSLYLSHSLS